VPIARHLPIPVEKSFAEDVRWKELDEKAQGTISFNNPGPLKIPVRAAKLVKQAWEELEILSLIFILDG
jgi:hypothetical protein